MLNTIDRMFISETHEMFRASVRRFIDAELTPNLEKFDQQGKISRHFWREAGATGMLCPMTPEIYGGLELDFSYHCIVNEELAYAGAPDGVTTHSDVVLPYLLKHGTDAHKEAWLAKMTSGEVVTAIAMTEPGAGSDVRGMRTMARRDGDDYIINGSKTYITNGQNADLIVLATKTDLEPTSKGLSLFLIDAKTPGFSRGRNLSKVGHWGADTSELFFSDMRVPAWTMLGVENKGFHLMVSELAQERLSIALSAQALAQRAFDEALSFVKDRKAFGKFVIEFQNTRFTLADIQARLQVGWAHVDWALKKHLAGRLSVEEAAAAKLWHTETQWMIVDAAMQLHGGAGYMNEYLIARLWRDARVRRIYGGSSEIMKEVISRNFDRAL